MSNFRERYEQVYNIDCQIKQCHSVIDTLYCDERDINYVIKLLTEKIIELENTKDQLLMDE